MSSSPRDHYSDPDPDPDPNIPPEHLEEPSRSTSTASASSRHTLPRRTTRTNHARASARGQAHHHDYDLHAGAEPGVDPRSGAAIAEYGHFRQGCVIDVIDYDCDDVVFRRVSNAGLVEMLATHGGARAHGLGDDAASMPPRMVRWINIGGVDWSVLSALAVKYSVLFPPPSALKLTYLFRVCVLLRSALARAGGHPARARAQPLQGGLLSRPPVHPRAVAFAGARGYG